MVQEIVERLVPRVVIPNHYLIWNIIRSQSTLLTADRWLRKQKRVENLSSALKTYNPSSLPAKTSIHSFGMSVDFDWAGVMPDGTELIAKTRHQWTATNDVTERFARIKTMDVEVLEPFRPK